MKKYDIIVSVPIHKKRKIKRGYNQSELILKDIALNTGILVDFEVLYKIKNTKPQSILGKEQRMQNVKNAYILKKCEIIANKNILVFDDIYTTGSTVNECSKILKENGAKHIGIITIAKD